MVTYHQTVERSSLKMDELRIDFSLDKKQPVYADVLTELKRRSLEEGDFSSSLSLAPMQTGLYSTKPNETKVIRKSKTGHISHSPNQVYERAQKSLQDSTRRLKAIEDHMWQHRQEERDLKRTEADIMRQQKQMEKNIKQYKTNISKQKAEGALAFQGKEAAFTGYCHEDLHSKEQMTKDKIQYSTTFKQKFNEETKQFMKNVNGLGFRYQSLMETLDKKRTEVEKLSSDFEAQIREKEDEQHHLKKELASLAIKINLEAQKKRHLTVDTQREKTQTALKDSLDANNRELGMKQRETSFNKVGTKYEQQQFKLERDIHSKQERTRTQQTQEGRNLADVHTRLKQKSNLQNFIQQEADDVQLNILNQESQRNVDIVNVKRRDKLEDFQQQVKDRNATEFKTWAQRATALENETDKRERFDRLKKLSKTVAQQDELEHSLYATAKNAESLRKKHTQTVEKLHSDLKTLKIHNARKLKEAAVEAQMAEQQMKQKITRELSELSKAVNSREESLRSLTIQRCRGREERRMLGEEKKESERRGKITKQTKLNTSIL